MKELVEQHRWLAELVGIISIVASLVFVGLQLQQTQQISMAEFDTSRVLITFEHRSQIMEHIDTWTKGNAGEELNQEDEEIYNMLIQNTWNRASAVSQARNRLDPNAGPGLLTGFAKFLHENPGAKKLWLQSNRDTETLRNVVGTVRSSGASTSSSQVIEFLEILDNQ